MSDDKELDITKFDIGMVGERDNPTMMMVAIPIKAYADQGAEGLDMFYGKMKRVEAVGSSLIREQFARRQKSKLLTPISPPMGLAS